jgi:hypothetical protein
METFNLVYIKTNLCWVPFLVFKLGFILITYEALVKEATTHGVSSRQSKQSQQPSSYIAGRRTS